MNPFLFSFEDVFERCLSKVSLKDILQRYVSNLSFDVKIKEKNCNEAWEKRREIKSERAMLCLTITFMKKDDTPWYTSSDTFQPILYSSFIAIK